jgi:polyisoprenoid-binding protein YceI
VSIKSSVALALWMVAATAALGAENHTIDAEHSMLTVFVDKSGFLSAFADDHVIRAPIAGGSISSNTPLAVEVSVRSANLIVLDPSLPVDKRAEVQARMLGPEVLDSTKYPDIRFTSTAVESVGADRWMVTGRLTIHGETQPITFAVVRQKGRFRGTVGLKQSDFGIQPISILGGTVRVKDELNVEFDIVTRR